MTRVRPQPEARARASRETPKEKAQRDATMLMHYRATFGTTSGREVLADLLRRCMVLAPRDSEMQEGAARVGYHIIGMLERDPSDLVRFALNSDVGELLDERDRTR